MAVGFSACLPGMVTISRGATIAPASSWSAAPFAAWWTHEQHPSSSWFTEGDDLSGNGTDTDTSSSEGLTNYDASDLPPTRDAGELLQHAYWAYAGAKGRWRRLIAKPVRRTRRLLKRTFGKGFQKGALSPNIVWIDCRQRKRAEAMPTRACWSHMIWS